MGTMKQPWPISTHVHRTSAVPPSVMRARVASCPTERTFSAGDDGSPGPSDGPALAADSKSSCRRCAQMQ